MAPPPSTPSRRGFAALALTAVLLLGACGDDDDTSTTTTTTTATTTTTSSSTTASTTTTTVDPQVEIEAAVQAYFGFTIDYVSGETIDPADPWIGDHVIGEARTLLIDGGKSFSDSGRRARPAEPSRYRIDVRFVDITGNTAAVEVCRVDDTVVYLQQSGEVVNDNVSTSLVDLDLRRVDARWLVSDVVRGNRTDGEAPCDSLDV